MNIINFGDIVEENGKTIRENNMNKIHNIPLRALVETHDGMRLYVVEQGRDCDGALLYWLSFNSDWSQDMYGSEMRFHARGSVIGGYSEDSLKVIKLPKSI